jgi:hypothetical protein
VKIRPKNPGFFSFSTGIARGMGVGFAATDTSAVSPLKSKMRVR